MGKVGINETRNAVDDVQRFPVSCSPQLPLSPSLPPRPHFLLFPEAQTARPPTALAEWRFTLEAVDGSAKIEAADYEENSPRERLELLAVVRGLEALEQPSRVTIVTGSRYVGHGIRFGLGEWRANNFHWEHFDEVVPVPNDDLWRRIDQALKFHAVECRVVEAEERELGEGEMKCAFPLSHSYPLPIAPSSFSSLTAFLRRISSTVI